MTLHEVKGDYQSSQVKADNHTNFKHVSHMTENGNEQPIFAGFKDTNNMKTTMQQQQLSKNHITSKQEDDASVLSTIAILRRHPMYDCLVLVKKYKPCLKSYTLEFPTKTLCPHTGGLNSPTDHQENNVQHCYKMKLKSVYLDEDDPVHRDGLDQVTERNEEEEIVHVPMNGLLTRLSNFERHNISIDSRVYAFAIGIKTAEKFLTNSSMKEINETPDVGY